MTGETVEQAMIVSQSSLKSSQAVTRIALFKSDGTPKALANPAAAQVDSVAATVGALVTDFNALLAKLRAAGVLLP